KSGQILRKVFYRSSLRDSSAQLSSATRNYPLPPKHLLFRPFLLIPGVEFKFNNLRGLFGGRRELPLLHGVLASLYQQRMAASQARALDAGVAAPDDCDPAVATY